MQGHSTEYGFSWGPALVERLCSDDKKGWVYMAVTTGKHPQGIQIYVTKTGKVRVFSAKGEWVEPKGKVDGNSYKA